MLRNSWRPVLLGIVAAMLIGGGTVQAKYYPVRDEADLVVNHEIFGISKAEYSAWILDALNLPDKRERVRQARIKVRQTSRRYVNAGLVR